MFKTGSPVWDLCGSDSVDLTLHGVTSPQGGNVYIPLKSTIVAMVMPKKAPGPVKEQQKENREKVVN